MIKLINQGSVSHVYSLVRSWCVCKLWISNEMQRNGHRAVPGGWIFRGGERRAVGQWSGVWEEIRDEVHKRPKASVQGWHHCCSGRWFLQDVSMSYHTRPLHQSLQCYFQVSQRKNQRGICTVRELYITFPSHFSLCDLTLSFRWLKPEENSSPFIIYLFFTLFQNLMGDFQLCMGIYSVGSTKFMSFKSYAAPRDIKK